MLSLKEKESAILIFNMSHSLYIGGTFYVLMNLQVPKNVVDLLTKTSLMVTLHQTQIKHVPNKSDL